jgi:1-acyl-sn-glycerol-3-phosphate acyltransferase
MNAQAPPVYPRRQAIRFILQRLARQAFNMLTDFTLEGRQHLPAGGPLLVVSNHFSFLDAVGLVAALPYPVEILGAATMPNAPGYAMTIARLWGFYTVYRGSASRQALRSAEEILAQRGVVAILPEAGAWSDVLRPPRPGAAFLAVRSEAPLLPVGLDGLRTALPAVRQGRRPRIDIRIGPVFGPLRLAGSAHRREQLDALGDQIMSHIAAVLPPERRGVYSEDPLLRQAAQAVAAYPWAESPESL